MIPKDYSENTALQSFVQEADQAVTQMLAPKENVEQIPIRKFIGYSVLELLKTCPRKYSFQAVQILSKTNSKYVTTEFGNAFHAGVQCLWKTGSLEKAFIEAFVTWQLPLTEATKDRSIWHVLNALILYKPQYDSLIEEGWEYVEHEPRGCITFPNNYNYYLHIDLILKNKFSGKYRIQEFKTTGLYARELYQHSNQVYGYALLYITCNKIPLEMTELEYVVFSTGTRAFHVLPLEFSQELCMQFLMNTLSDCEVLELYHNNKYYPTNAGGCRKYNTPCSLLDTCTVDYYNNYRNLEAPIETPKGKYVTTFSTICEHINVE